MGLGLPLQGPGWTEWACVRGKERVAVLHRDPQDGLRGDVHVFGRLQHLWCVVNSLVPKTNELKLVSRG